MKVDLQRALEGAYVMGAASRHQLNEKWANLTTEKQEQLIIKVLGDIHHMCLRKEIDFAAAMTKALTQQTADEPTEDWL